MPRAMKQCGYSACRERVSGGTTYCPTHRAEFQLWRNSTSPPSTRSSRALRMQVLREEPICRDCGVAPSTERGHIVPAYAGGTNTRANSKGQCRPCNIAQIQADKA